MSFAEIKEKQLVQKLFLCFWMYAVLGWCYEVFLEVVVYRWGFHNRGELFGPYCPIYGTGALLFLLCFGWFKKKKYSLTVEILVKPLLIFLGCMLVATAVELAASYVLEFTKGSWPWQTYSRYKYNFQARIALSTSIRFGLGGLLFMYVVQPLFDRLLSKPSRKAINIIAAAVLVIVVADFIVTKATGYTPKLAQVENAVSGIRNSGFGIRN